MRNDDVAEALFTAFEVGDADAARALCDGGLKASRNGGPAMDLESLLAFSALVKRVIPDFHYENAVRTVTPAGFVEEHDVCGTLPDGSDLRVAACVVAEVSDGKVTRVREYLDTAAAAGLADALP